MAGRVTGRDSVSALVGAVVAALTALLADRNNTADAVKKLEDRLDVLSAVVCEVAVGAKARTLPRGCYRGDGGQTGGAP